MKDIVRRNGLGPSGLYRGLSSTVARNGIWNAIYFGVYHNVKNYALDPQVRSSRSINFICNQEIVQEFIVWVSGEHILLIRHVAVLCRN